MSFSVMKKLLVFLFVLLNFNLKLSICLDDVPINLSGDIQEKDGIETKEFRKEDISKRDIYYSGFQVKRQEQIASVKAILKLADYGKQYKLVSLLLEKIFYVMQTARVVIMQAGYYPGDQFPEDEAIAEALGNIVENVAFFGDIALRLPEITHKIYNNQNEWRVLASWAIGFANDTSLFDGGNAKLLSLMAQELEVIPKEATFINPYAKKSVKVEESEKSTESKETKKSKKKKKARRKGPRLGGKSEL